jgi:hypothetical protein
MVYSKVRVYDEDEGQCGYISLQVEVGVMFGEVFHFYCFLSHHLG